MKKLLSLASLFVLLVAVAQGQYRGQDSTRFQLWSPSRLVTIGTVTPNYNMAFYGGSRSIVFALDFKDTLKVITHAPMDSCARVFVRWITTYYNGYVNSLKERIRYLEGKRDGN